MMIDVMDVIDVIDVIDLMDVMEVLDTIAVIDVMDVKTMQKQSKRTNSSNYPTEISLFRLRLTDIRPNEQFLLRLSLRERSQKLFHFLRSKK